ncbi:MAG TPA: hypothetical protein PKW37_05730, partial [Salinivirgaceae bacterium]|nr:hypothetical protein [Salinivirgaceae bacterium]
LTKIISKIHFAKLMAYRSYYKGAYDGHFDRLSDCATVYRHVPLFYTSLRLRLVRSDSVQCTSFQNPLPKTVCNY